MFGGSDARGGEWALVGVAAALLAACSQQGAPPGPPEPLESVVRVVGGAREGDRLPLIVGLHGRGDRPERFGQVFETFPRPARVALLRAPIEEGDGRAWFIFRYGFDHAATQMEALFPRVAATTEALRAAHPTIGRPLLMGFSQGAMLAYPMATRYRDQYAAVFPVAGLLAGRFAPHHRAEVEGMPPIFAFHGADDPVIAASDDRERLAPLRRLGAPLTYREIPSTPHWINRPMREALFAAMVEALPEEGPREGPQED